MKYIGEMECDEQLCPFTTNHLCYKHLVNYKITHSHY